MAQRQSVDIVVAVRNEEGNIPCFVEVIDRFNLIGPVNLKILFVEDSSTDRTRDILRELAKTTSIVDYVFLKKSYGQAPAVALGVARSKADATIMMDVDGGHPTELIPQMIQQFLDGATVVQATRRSLNGRGQIRDSGSKLFNFVFRIITGINTEQQNVFYRLISRTMVERLLRDNRWKHSLRINVSSYQNDSMKFIPFDARERITGLSKYNLKRLIVFAVVAAMSSISLVRFANIILLLLCTSIFLYLYGHHVLSALLLLQTLFLIVGFYTLSADDVLERMEIYETS